MAVVARLYDRDTLWRVARTDADSLVRDAALRRLDDVKALRDLWESFAAGTGDPSLSALVALNHPSSWERARAVKYVDDEDILGQVLQADSERAPRLAAIERLRRAGDLRAAAGAGPDPIVRLAAFRKLAECGESVDPAELRRVEWEAYDAADRQSRARYLVDIARQRLDERLASEIEAWSVAPEELFALIELVIRRDPRLDDAIRVFLDRCRGNRDAWEGYSRDPDNWDRGYECADLVTRYDRFEDQLRGGR
jgi:hypothetical protein